MRIENSRPETKNFCSEVIRVISMQADDRLHCGRRSNDGEEWMGRRVVKEVNDKLLIWMRGEKGKLGITQGRTRVRGRMLGQLQACSV